MYKITNANIKEWAKNYDGELIEDIVQLILQDRKAWGEYVIGEDEPEPEIPVNDYYWRFRNELRARQRQRNQGEKTDE